MKGFFGLLVMFVLTIFAVPALAQGLADPALAQGLADPAQVLPGLDHVIAWLSNPPVIVGTIGTVLVGILMRVWPSKNPWSWAWIVARVTAKIGAALTAFAKFLDSIFPQNIVR